MQRRLPARHPIQRLHPRGANEGPRADGGGRREPRMMETEYGPGRTRSPSFAAPSVRRHPRVDLRSLLEDVVAVLDVERADGAACVARETGPQGHAVVLLLERVLDEVQAAERVVLDRGRWAHGVAFAA